MPLKGGHPGDIQTHANPMKSRGTDAIAGCETPETPQGSTPILSHYRTHESLQCCVARVLRFSFRLASKIHPNVVIFGEMKFR